MFDLKYYEMKNRALLASSSYPNHTYSELSDFQKGVWFMIRNYPDLIKTWEKEVKKESPYKGNESWEGLMLMKIVKRMIDPNEEEKILEETKGY